MSSLHFKSPFIPCCLIPNWLAHLTSIFSFLLTLILFIEPFSYYKKCFLQFSSIFFDKTLSTVTFFFFWSSISKYFLLFCPSIHILVHCKGFYQLSLYWNALSNMASGFLILKCDCLLETLKFTSAVSECWRATLLYIIHTPWPWC